MMCLVENHDVASLEKLKDSPLWKDRDFVMHFLTTLPNNGPLFSRDSVALMRHFANDKEIMEMTAAKTYGGAIPLYVPPDVQVFLEDRGFFKY